jgi:hypothetical protein
MKIVKLIILIIFLFNSSAYSLDTLRPELMTNQGKETERSRDAIAQVIERNFKSERNMWLSRAPVLWLELINEPYKDLTVEEIAKAKDDYFNNLPEVRKIASILEDIVAQNEGRYLIDILQEALSHPEIQGNQKRKEAIEELLKQRHGNFPLKNIAYQALIEMVRQWPKKDRHTHVTASIPIEKTLEKLKELGKTAGFIEKLKKLVKREIEFMETKRLNPVAMKMFQALLNESEIQHVTVSQFNKIIQYPGGREVKDVWMKALEGEELKNAVIDEIVTAIQQNFTDGVTDLEIRFNPFKEGILENYESISDYLTKLTRKIEETEKSAQAAFGYKYRVTYMFSLARERMMRQMDGTEDELYVGRLKGVDIAGTEPFDWKVDEQKTIQDVNNNFALDWLAMQLRNLKETGYEITIHLGDFGGARPQNDPNGHVAFIKAHLEKLDGIIRRIGHGRRFTPGKIRDWDKPIGGKDFWIDNTPEGKALLDIVKRMNPVPIIESTQEFDTLDMDILRENYPNNWWHEPEFHLDVVYGSDGLYTARPVTLSQWLVRLMLASPTPESPLSGRTIGITVKQMKQVVSARYSL